VREHWLICREQIFACKTAFIDIKGWHG
jgi:hypothetical protein